MSENRFAMVSEWMIHGNINQYIEAHPEADRLRLVRPVRYPGFLTLTAEGSSADRRCERVDLPPHRWNDPRGS